MGLICELLVTRLICDNNPVFYVDPSGNATTTGTYGDGFCEAAKKRYREAINNSGNIFEAYIKAFSEIRGKKYLEDNNLIDGKGKLTDAGILEAIVSFLDYLPEYIQNLLKTINNNATKKARETPGVVTGGDNLSNPSKMLKGTNGNIGVIPKVVADKLKGRNFNSFDAFRRAFWKAVSETKYASEFKERKVGDMQSGTAPHTDSSQKIKENDELESYELHHITPINQGGDVYSLDNIVIVTPRYHAEMLLPDYHGYNGFKKFFK